MATVNPPVPRAQDDVPCELCDVGPLADPMVVVSSRRATLRRLAFVGGAAIAAPALLPKVALASDGRRPTIVCVFLRGGLDGLATVAPLDDADLARSRPTIAVPDLVPLDGRFGAHPALAPLVELAADDLVGFVHGVGNVAPIRSHFSAQATMEGGAAAEHDASDGWLGRLVRERAGTGPLAAVGIGTRTPPSLTGSAAIALADVSVRAAPSAGGEPAATTSALAGFAARHPTVLDDAVSGALTAIEVLRDAGVGDVQPAADYPASGLGQGLRQVAAMVRAEVPVQVACVDAGGFDLHADLGPAGGGRQADLLDDLARSLHAFLVDLGDRARDVVLVAVTEFGRRLQENGSGGTDHGRGGLAIVAGGRAVPGVHGPWPGLAADDLDRPRSDDPAGDLAVTTDVRDLWAEVVTASALPGDHPDVVGRALPGHTPTSVGALRVG